MFNNNNKKGRHRAVIRANQMYNFILFTEKGIKEIVSLSFETAEMRAHKMVGPPFRIIMESDPKRVREVLDDFRESLREDE